MRTPPPPASTFLAFFFFSFSIFLLAYDGLAAYAVEQQPLDPGDFASGGSSGGGGGGVAGPAAGNTVPAFPVVQAQNNQTCRLDLSDELFGGVAEACGRDLDRGRCCPVLAAWLFAAHARSALEVRGAPSAAGDDGLGDDDSPMMPDDSQKCVDSLQSSLQGRNIHLARPNASCDAVLCFCGIRLHQISSLSCPAAFNVSISSSSHSSAASYRNATPTAAVRDLEKSCRNSSYAGCTRCLASLDKLRGGVVGSGGAAGWGDRASRMLGRDCQLMGLTWLLARNRTAYIPTVSAVLRAIMYSAHPAAPNPPPPGDRRHGQPPQYKCSPDQENMPLAVDSLQFERADGSSSAAASAALSGGVAVAAVLFSSLLLLASTVAAP